jgi:hypothetical protein
MVDLLIDKWSKHQVCQLGNCKGQMSNIVHFIRSPNIICIDGLPENVNICSSVKLTGVNSCNMIFKLVGIIYHGEFHFTSRYISSNNEMSYHDGMISEKYSYNGDITKFEKSALRQYNSKKAVMAIYARK